MQAVVALGGELNDSALVRSALDGAGLIVAADGGARRLAALGIAPHALIGDFDSLGPDELSDYRVAGAAIVPHPAPQQRTDADVAIAEALARGATSLIALGVFGGDRLDHELGNLELLAGDRLRGIPTWAVDGWTAIAVLHGAGVRETHFHGAPGDYASIVPITDRVEGVETVGLKWPLSDAVFERGRGQGISNELIGDRAMIRIAIGKAFATHHFRQQRLP